MSEESEESDPPNNNEVIKEEISLQYHLYISIFAIIFYCSWVVPGVCFFIYFLQVFLPYFFKQHPLFWCQTAMKTSPLSGGKQVDELVH